MTIVLNGERRDVPDATTVAELLRYLQIDARLVAVELNREVVKRGRYEATPVTPGAEVEIVAFVGGGSPPTRLAPTSSRAAHRPPAPRRRART